MGRYAVLENVKRLYINICKTRNSWTIAKYKKAS